MTSRLEITIEFGTQIEDACEDACRIARILGCQIEFEFNGIKCLARPIKPNARELARKWHRLIAIPPEAFTFSPRPKIVATGEWH